MNSPCVNGGKCSLDSNSNLICSCPSKCQTKRRQTVLRTIQSKQYNFSTPDGFTGSNCQQSTAVSACASAPCINNGICSITTTGGYTCTCPPSYTGTNCDVAQSSPCAAAPCQNNGNCVPTSVTTYTCNCQGESNRIAHLSDTFTVFH